jgi:S-DNA-T family DNA segregation ATPase FtsK/SpoIIIE
MRTTTHSALDIIPDAAREFVGRRLAEVAGLLALAASGGMALALVSWSAQDPSWNHATRGPVRNLLGGNGAVAADLVMQVIGLASVAILFPLACWGWRLLTRRRLRRVRLRLLLWLIGGIGAAAVLAIFPTTDRWPLPTGLGGVIGDAILYLPRQLFGGAPLVTLFYALICGAVALLALSAASGYGFETDLYEAYDEPEEAPPPKRPAASEENDAEGDPGFGLVSLGAIIHAAWSVSAAMRRLFTRKRPPAPVAAKPPIESVVRREPAFADDSADADAAPTIETEYTVRVETPGAPGARARVVPPAADLRPGKRVVREQQPSFLDRNQFELPHLNVLSEAKRRVVSKISEDALKQNARLLEGVLEDFGVKGEILNVRPGPVVTLYELEPAPGIKSSRVIGLADDIARSMSAISARVAVVQGRNAIGIELPNQKRETVYLRELLASEDFEKSRHRLAIALGKTIGGEPVIVDLARMPHLLVAGTTGSGKSVAINTMILSLLYRLKPNECKLIMVDPKMLELSAYDGIPHLLTPVVTDPKKAVVALKWAVREMEDRYKKMSKIGVRNIDGFNARVSEAAAKGKPISRTIQTGYDRESGEAIYEREDMNLEVLPYIVVIVDEMADLMMVAGKDIEGAIQRLAQMARAAGIHLIMATQRPSVDVITGTIKANFPTRISFQVTSKIDSRTILGEQGAEQLLGQGDMLYMAGGGRISRVHGPFVSDEEVEKVVAHLKTQGAPEYLEQITADEEPEFDEDGPAPGSMDSEESGDLYDRAVNIVLRDRKCSTSYIQRRLSVGYNKAASLVERMEKEGVVGAANHAGKREILVGGGVDRGAFEPEPL